METRNIDSLIVRLTKDEMPIFAHTAKYVIDASSRANSPVTELAWGILRDPSLTAKVLKLANSIYYNQSSSKISTVSRAILQLGFDMVKSMCITASLVENVLKGAPRERAILEMTRAFHAAVQAKSFAIRRKEPAVEEVFIASLLHRIGHLAFWCFGGELADSLESALQKPGYTQAMAEQEVLGCRMHQLGVQLAHEWRLGSLVEMSLEGNPKSDARVYSIVLSHKLAQSVEDGWETPESGAVISSIAKFLKVELEEVKQIVSENAFEAAAVAKDYGLGKYEKLILPPPLTEHKEKSVEGVSESTPFPMPDPLLQLEILRELSASLKDSQLNINGLFSTLLEGIFRGIGMDRVILLLVSPDRRNLVGKYGLGWEQQKIERFLITFEPQVPHIFSLVLKENKPIWVRGHKTPQYVGYLTPEIKSFLSTNTFFVMPLAIKNRAVGLVCADRYPSGRELDEGSFASFHFFGQMANAALSSFA